VVAAIGAALRVDWLAGSVIHLVLSSSRARNGGLRIRQSALTASLRPQQQKWHPACDQTTRRANHQKSVHPLTQKYFAFAVGQITDLNPRVSPEGGAGRDRHERCGEMRWTRMSRRRTWLRRTAKSCGPDAPTLASSCADVSVRRWWQESPVTRESSK
jgi:hypothetical protein